MEKIRSTTVLAIVHNGEVAIGADGQATMEAQ
jgi:ATP-dependent HslUV protease subunit HslV